MIANARKSVKIQENYGISRTLAHKLQMRADHPVTIGHPGYHPKERVLRNAHVYQGLTESHMSLPEGI